MQAIFAMNAVLQSVKGNECWALVTLSLKISARDVSCVQPSHNANV